MGGSSLVRPDPHGQASIGACASDGGASVKVRHYSLTQSSLSGAGGCLPFSSVKSRGRRANSATARGRPGPGSAGHARRPDGVQRCSRTPGAPRLHAPADPPADRARPSHQPRPLAAGFGEVPAPDSPGRCEGVHAPPPQGPTRSMAGCSRLGSGAEPGPGPDADCDAGSVAASGPSTATSGRISMRHPVNRAANRAFWPSRPIASDS